MQGQEYEDSLRIDLAKDEKRRNIEVSLLQYFQLLHISAFT